MIEGLGDIIEDAVYAMSGAALFGVGGGIATTSLTGSAWLGLAGAAGGVVAGFFAGCVVAAAVQFVREKKDAASFRRGEQNG